MALNSEITTLLRITEELPINNNFSNSALLIQVVKSKKSINFYSSYNGIEFENKMSTNNNIFRTNSWFEIIFSKSYWNSSMKIFIIDHEKGKYSYSENFLNEGFAIRKNLGKIFIGGDQISELTANFKSLKIYYKNSIEKYDFTKFCVEEICKTGISPDKCTSCNLKGFLNIINQKKIEGICSENCDLNKIKSTNPYIPYDKDFVELIKFKEIFNEIKYFFSSFQLKDLEFPIKQLIFYN